METKKVTIEVPRKASIKDVKLLVKKVFTFDVKKYYGKSKNFQKVRIKWQLSV